MNIDWVFCKIQITSQLTILDRSLFYEALDDAKPRGLLKRTDEAIRLLKEPLTG